MSFNCLILFFNAIMIALPSVWYPIMLVTPTNSLEKYETLDSTNLVTRPVIEAVGNRFREENNSGLIVKITLLMFLWWDHFIWC